MSFILAAPISLKKKPNALEDDSSGEDSSDEDMGFGIFDGKCI